MRKTFLACLVMLAFTAGGPLLADSAEESKNLYDQAAALADQGNKPDAIPLLRQSIQLNEENFWAKKLLVDILAEMGEELYNKGYQKSAFNYFREAVKYWSNHPTASFWYRKLKPEEAQLVDMPGAQPAMTPTNTGESSSQPAAVTVKTQTQGASVLVVTQKTVIIQPGERPVSARGILLTDEQLQKLLAIQERSAEDIKKQRERQFLILIVAGASVAVIMIAIILLVVARVTGKPIGYSLKRNRKTLELTTPGMIEKVKELIRAYKMDELARIIENGEMDWSVIRQYLAEMDRTIRLEVLSMVDRKINREIQPLTSNQAELLMTLLTDGDDFVRRKANLIMARSLVDTSQPVRIGTGENEIRSLPPSQDVYQKGERNRRQTDYFIDVNDLKGLIPLSKIVDKKMFGGNHSANVAKGTYQVAIAMGHSIEESNIFYIAGLAHNIGYLDLNSELIQKPDKLTRSEEEEIRTHTQKGLELLDFFRLPEAVAAGILDHHERWDGSGYPSGKSGEDIPVVARIISVIDAYYAITSPRPYRPEKTREEAADMIKKLKGKWFDPKIVDIFLFLFNQNLL